ncbi:MULTISPECIES: hypothetical protein [unclassified Janthinobacterium]|uniref:hypothetical protein n=1 Tax=unclassified Janthinobacterium TaxID=2610881 RepID=UPI00111425BA|nr:MULTISPECIES: hypothetical protein [unclassified Janthinobacterium]
MNLRAGAGMAELSMADSGRIAPDQLAFNRPACLQGAVPFCHNAVARWRRLRQFAPYFSYKRLTIGSFLHAATRHMLLLLVHVY